jgi:hypothetical protein
MPVAHLTRRSYAAASSVNYSTKLLGAAVGFNSSLGRCPELSHECSLYEPWQVGRGKNEKNERKHPLERTTLSFESLRLSYGGLFLDGKNTLLQLYDLGEKKL